MKKRLFGLVRLLIGIALLPAAFASLVAAARALGGLAEGGSSARWFLAGAAAYPLLHAATTGLGLDGVRRIFYVLAHELTHAIAAWMSGYRVHRLRVGTDGGHVDASHVNAFVALAPYIVPLYALLAVAGYRAWLWHAGGHPGPAAYPVFLAALGAALSFHWLFTVDALWSVKQPDLAIAGGFLFSLSLIGLGNGLVLLAALKCLFPKLVSLSAAGRLAWDFTWRPLTLLAAAPDGVKK